LKQLSRLLNKVVDAADASNEATSLFFEEGPTPVPSKGPRKNA
jgi:hypothetical protein